MLAAEQPDTVEFLAATVRYVREFGPAEGRAFLEKVKDYPADGSLRALARQPSYSVDLGH
jgi:hypothetical protein